jgi:hypothetical protein
MVRLGLDERDLVGARGLAGTGKPSGEGSKEGISFTKTDLWHG